jgi:uncharacterized protein YciI
MLFQRRKFTFLSASVFALVLATGVSVSAQTGAGPTASSAAPATMQFFARLLPPRPTFMQDITPAETPLMQQHFAYWTEQFKTGKVLLLGPVMDPKGAFGVFVLEMSSEAEARAMVEGDPTIKAGMNHYDIAPMHVAMHR